LKGKVIPVPPEDSAIERFTMKRRLISFGWLAIATATLLGSPATTTAQIQVDSTNPGAAPQGTTNLNVTITGSGFQKGAKAQWFLSGTTNPGGVTVNSTAFNRSSQLTANITIASDAVVSGFDVVVKNTNGRTGKGTDLFAVTTKGTPIGCSTTGTPSGFTLVAELNPVQANGAALITTLNLGNAVRVRPVDLNHDGIVDSLVVFVTSGTGSSNIPGTYVFLIDPITGLPQATNPVTGMAWQNPLLLLTGVRATIAAVGDVNGDKVPDFLMGGADNTAYVFVGNVAPSTFNLSYTAYRIQPTSDAPANWAVSLAMGDLDGDGADEIAIGATPGKKGPTTSGVFIFKYAAGSVNYVQKFQNPAGLGFADAIAIGNIDGNAGNELVVGDAGDNLVYVFPAPAQQSSYFTITGPGPNFGRGLGIADVNLDGFPDLVVITGDKFSGSDTTAQAFVFAGSVRPDSGFTNSLLPATGLAYSWAAPNFDLGDMMLAGGAVLVGTPNANNPKTGSACTVYIGAAHLFTGPFGASEMPNYVFEPPVIPSSGGLDYGYGLAVAPGYPFIVIGAKYTTVGTTAYAGQVYVYKKN
jgi:FG-GAP-like repeat